MTPVNRDGLLTTWMELREQGWSQQEVADKLNMKLETFKRALFRARAAGDPRAVR